MMYYKPPLFRADVRKIAHGLNYNTYNTVHAYTCMHGRSNNCLAHHVRFLKSDSTINIT